MIKSFRHKGLQRFYEDDDRSKVPAEMVERIGLILATLDAAGKIEGINRPSFRLHQLKGQSRGLMAIAVRANWRIVFRFKDGAARDVDFIDHH